MGFKLFLLLEKILMILPKKIRKYFFTTLATIAYYVSSKYRNIAYKNLDFIFENKIGKKEKDEIVRYSFKNLLFNFLHLMEIRYMSKNELAKKVTVKNIEAVQRVHVQKRSVIYVTSHYSAWELGGSAIGAFAEPIAAVYRKMKNPTYQEWVLDSRSKFGNSSLEKSNVIKPLIKLVKNGGACGILIDTAMNQREGLEVDFFGKKIRQTSTPAYLARKYNAAIIPVTIKTDDEENYELIFFDEIAVEKTDNEQEDIQKATQLQADWLTKIITDNPKFWFWVHRRFKSEYPQIYKN
ncbi:MAG: lipid A biosynthesis acyltransferase [Sulfurimonas sp. RIFOXYD12_FULL_33_39]|uniref:lipid A biosynthesis lauroyl acyltransferase n=1 Tax=unclassified Sulfurimonas TaxID=2623549 RepID=UPI0008B05027|nr:MULTISPECIES: lipid A biosynthesis lauroyl acyltransferase [unclassified Sulfurimonas]OHE10529.1 MAG: lipid A biosynthesis acyltransferase [Sulfurimonas sp. RIFOXYD12_FULL_33_39]OHE14988.1 MAG: lipid A biosynthesis acyltransferase [Sulfurimonas sp. RIFOXYD2_FULL_34_21]DAB27746.1 MAG TPA: lipid A biosynthesis acyltransferase [Sulfurimonas sp. UBA10385]